MKYRVELSLSALTLAFLSSSAFAANGTMGMVDVSQLFNSSAYVQKANKELQDNVKKMEANLKEEQEKLQKQIDTYQKSKKQSQLEHIKEMQGKLAKMTQEYQQKIQAEQARGMQKFSDYVRTAVAKVAKEKKLETVLNNTAVVYTDNSQLVDITKDVASEMKKDD